VRGTGSETDLGLMPMNQSFRSKTMMNVTPEMSNIGIDETEDAVTS